VLVTLVQGQCRVGYIHPQTILGEGKCWGIACGSRLEIWTAPLERTRYMITPYAIAKKIKEPPLAFIAAGAELLISKPEASGSM
jgi:hypothetical protein